MQETLKVTMNNHVCLAGGLRAGWLHKNQTYAATHATNQPHWERDGLVFVHASDGSEVLLDKTDYRIAS